MKLYVGNLAWAVDDAKLKEIFAAFGTVSEAVVISDKYSGRSKGFGFVTIDEDEGGAKAIAEMNGKAVEGREIKVSEAQPREEN
ncbi:RNA-binding protein [Candidatus Pacearchaeota archaeon]|jgi:RNA recognition motif-containing protein|nr:RNA-binding protein [Candidatus Pacearchaeota archaeon]|tara:strand:+ start:6896 stop:7147 length:252 start_codon:yes stop_codon:yes gene_type:complete